MAPQDLAPYERAARIYCTRMQLDPDDMVQATGTAVVALANLRPRWFTVAEQMVHMSVMLVAMREAQEVFAPVVRQ